MKLKAFMLVFLLLFGMLNAVNYMGVRFGFMNPDGAKSGVIGGFSYGRIFDESVSLDFGLDYFYKGYTDDKKISVNDTQADNEIITYSRSADIKTIYVPVMANLNVKLPLDRQIKPFFKAGLGWGFLWEDVYIAAEEDDPNTQDNEKHDEIDDVKFYNGFNWLVGAGVKYRLARKSFLMGEFFYNGGKMTRNRDKTEYGITWDEIDMSGIGLRIGIEFEL
ncbi:MAG: outer membrane beta-barrel protein [Candidatus Cloacimonetes bacterium]|nr:outer membrane beta-barrel protein [Candidatus Cloacimonadota bacterium]